MATYRKKLPKYIYTPERQRAFLVITADLFGNWSAGYCVFADILNDEIGGQRVLNYGPYVEDAPDIDAVVIQLFNAYHAWKKEQDGLRSS